MPRDRDGTFEPQLVKKRQARLEAFDEKVLALYGGGMSTRDINAHLHELYGTDVSHELISKAAGRLGAVSRMADAPARRHLADRLPRCASRWASAWTVSTTCLAAVRPLFG